MDQIDGHTPPKPKFPLLLDEEAQEKLSGDRFRFFCKPFFETIRQGQEESEERLTSLERVIDKISPSLDLLNSNFNRFMNGDHNNPPVEVRLDRIERALSDLGDEARKTNSNSRLSGLEQQVSEIRKEHEQITTRRSQLLTTIISRLVVAIILGLLSFIGAAVIFWLQYNAGTPHG